MSFALRDSRLSVVREPAMVFDNLRRSGGISGAVPRRCCGGIVRVANRNPACPGLPWERIQRICCLFVICFAGVSKAVADRKPAGDAVAFAAALAFDVGLLWLLS